MTLEEATREIFYHAFVFTLHPKKCLEALKVIRKSLIDYKEIKDDYADLDNRLRTANTENDELKRLLRLAVEDFETAMLEEKCKVCALEHRDYDEICKWRHHDEIMNLLGGNENDND